MSDKQDTPGEAEAVPDISPQSGDNPFERMRHFSVQRDVVMRPTGSWADADDPAPSDESSDAEDEGAERAGEHQTTVEEYRRRQRIDRDS